MSKVVFQGVVHALDHVSQGFLILELNDLLRPLTSLLLNIQQEFSLCQLHVDSLSFAVQMRFVFLMSQRYREFFSLL